MYKLIADSGSTKTDWVLLKNGEKTATLSTIGFNPYFQSESDITAILIKELKPIIESHTNKLEAVYYYGTGCSTIENCDIIKRSLNNSLIVESVNVSHDLLAAARALCNKEWGIASILGTGSNSCLYNGNEIIENVPSTGYLWSDYGGGSQIGKYFIREYFEDALPADLRVKFEEKGFNREVILDNVYKKSLPGKYLASVSLFAADNSDHPFVAKILEECFGSFFTKQVNRYTNSKNYKVHTVGSVGFFFKKTLEKVAHEHGYVLGNVIKSPMEGLIRYHTSD
jgi:glucosamine kinase